LKSKKILILFTEDRKLDTYPYILNMIKLLSDRGCSIDFIGNDLMYQELNIKNFTFYSISEHPIVNNEYVEECIKFIKKEKKKYDYIIAYSMEGIAVIAYLNINRFKKISAAYFNMEFLDKLYKPRIFWNFIFFKFLLKIKINENIKILVAQDKHRLNYVKKFIDFSGKMFELPNSYIGFTDEKNDYAYKKFNIDKNKKIILYTGAIECWCFDEELPNNIIDILSDGKFVLLINGFSRDNTLEKVKDRYKDLIKNQHIIISTELLDEYDYTKLVQSSYIGLPWYKKIVDYKCFYNWSASSDSNFHSTFEDNLYYMGLSSGKLCKYLSCSLPVILPSFYFGYTELINKYRIGEIADSTKEIYDKIKYIDSNYSIYAEKIKSYYLNEVEYKKMASPIIDEILK